MSITREEALKSLEYAITLCKEQEAKNKGVILRHAYIDLIPSGINFINQQTTPTDIEEVLGKYEKLFDFKNNKQYIRGEYVFNFYNIIKQHLTSTPIKAEEQPVVTSRVEEALDKIYNWSGIPFVVTTNTKILEKALQDKDKKYELLKTHFEDATGWNNELTRKLQDKDNEIEKLVNETIQMIEDRLFEDRISKVEFTPLLKKLQIIKEG